MRSRAAGSALPLTWSTTAPDGTPSCTRSSSSATSSCPSRTATRIAGDRCTASAREIKIGGPCCSTMSVRSTSACGNPAARNAAVSARPARPAPTRATGSSEPAGSVTSDHRPCSDVQRSRAPAAPLGQARCAAGRGRAASRDHPPCVARTPHRDRTRIA